MKKFKNILYYIHQELILPIYMTVLIILMYYWENMMLIHIGEYDALH